MVLKVSYCIECVEGNLLEIKREERINFPCKINRLKSN